MDNVEQTQNAGHRNIDPETNRMPIAQQLIAALSFLVLVFGASYIPDLLATLAPEPDAPEDTETTRVPADRTGDATDPFEELSVTAASAYVWDVQAQRALYHKNADAQRPLASITKLMTALVAYELLENDAPVNITIDAIRQEGQSGFSDGEQFSARDLSDLTLISSSNDGAYALAAAAGTALNTHAAPQSFVEAMNVRAEEIGLSQTHFSNPTGLDVSETEAGAYGSARDVAFLMEYIITEYPEVLELTRENSTEVYNGAGDYHLAENTNTSVTDIAGLIGSKTGYTTLAGGNLVVGFDAGLNRPIIVSVLGSTRSGRFRDAVALVDATRQYFSSND